MGKFHFVIGASLITFVVSAAPLAPAGGQPTLDQELVRCVNLKNGADISPTAAGSGSCVASPLSLPTFAIDVASPIQSRSAPLRLKPITTRSSTIGQRLTNTYISRHYKQWPSHHAGLFSIHLRVLPDR